MDKRLWSKLSLRRVWNFTLIWLSYQLSRLLRKPLHWGLPVAIAIEPTTACNLRCPECPSGLRSFSRPTGNLKKDLFEKVIDEVSPHAIWVTFYFQGEPFINPAFLDMVAYARQKKLFTMSSTNGHFLNDDNARLTVESGLDKLIISIDGATQETYEAYRREGKLDHVLQGARNLVKWKRKLNSSTPEIVFQTVVVRPNEHDIPDIYRLAAEIGIDRVQLKTAQVYDYEDGNPLIPENLNYARYRPQANGKWAIKGELHPECWRMWHGCVITWDGLVVPCCFDKDAQHRLGDISKMSLHQVWRSDKYKRFRKQILKGRKHIDICKNCTEGVKDVIRYDAVEKRLS